MNHRKISAACVGLCLALALGGCGGDTRDYEGEINTLKRENVALQEQVQRLQEELGQLRSTKLERWELQGWGSSEKEPASVHLTAQPLFHEEGQTAELLVMLEGAEAARAVCRWDGETFTADLELTPEDGYSYYCVVTGPDGNAERVTLSTPDHPAVPKLTYLKSSLTSYVNASLTDARVDRDILRVDVIAAIQTPLLTQDGKAVTVHRAELQWGLDDALLDSEPVEVAEGETEGGYGIAVEGVTIRLPEMDEESLLELYLCVELSDGHILEARVGSWSMLDGELSEAVG